MKRAALLSAALAVFCLGAALLPAAACVPPPGWPRQARIDAAAMARTMFEAAATVDVAVAEQMTDDYEVGTSPTAYASARTGYAIGADTALGPLTPQRVSTLLREEWGDEGVRIHYRVVERLKGAGPTTFTLNGARLPPSTKPSRSAAKPSNWKTGVKSRLESRDLSEWEGFGACITALYSDVGRRYLVFRDGEGRLLQQRVSVRFRGETVQVGGPVYAEVSGAEDRWLATVRATIPLPHP